MRPRFKTLADCACALLLGITLFSCSGTSNEVEFLSYKMEGDERWGIIDFDGNVIISDEFEECPSIVKEGRFFVKNEEGQYEYYTAEKDFKKIGGEYVQASIFSDGLAGVVEKDKAISYIDRDGKTVLTLTPSIEQASQFQEGLAVGVTTDGKRGYFNKKGEWVIKPKYKGSSPFYQGIAFVRDEDGKDFFIDKKGNVKLEIPKDYDIHNMPGEGLFTYSEEGKDGWGVMNLKGEKVIKISERNKRINPFMNGYAAFSNSDEKWGLMDQKGEIKIRPKYKDFVLCKNVIIYREEDGKYGILDYNGEVVKRAEYANIIPFLGDKEKTYALDGNDWILIDKAGEEVGNIVLEQLTPIPWQEFDNYRCMPDMMMLTNDYVDVKGTATAVLSYLNSDCTIDKVNYHTKPGDIPRLYKLSLTADDFKWKRDIDLTLKEAKSYTITLNAEFQDYMTTARYERKLKKTYYGSYYENELAGYDYNANTTPETLRLVFTPKAKVNEKINDIYEAMRNLMQSNGFEQLSEEKGDSRTSVFYSKTVSGVKYNAGLHNNGSNINLAIGKTK